MINDSYAAAVRDETWIAGVLVDSCVSYGEARRRDNEIVATDRLRDSTLRDDCEAELARVRTIVRAIDAARIRVAVRATSDEGVSATIVITVGDVSIVTTPEHAIADADLLRSCPVGDSRSRLPNVPLIWRNGSAAVLLHEAAGHAAEHGHAPVQWPKWLNVRIGFAVRRESFRDVPLRRMTNVVVEQAGAPFELPPRHVDIHYVSGGSYEPLTEMVTIDVAVPKFTIRATRQEIARSIRGATGDPIRYPGVICSREGQELFVGSYAPVIVTTELP